MDSLRRRLKRRLNPTLNISPGRNRAFLTNAHLKEDNGCASAVTMGPTNHPSPIQVAFKRIKLLNHSTLRLRKIYETSKLKKLYHSLPELGSGEARFIHLHPGNLSDPLVCTINTASLGTSPEYEALSYTWRNSESVDGFPDVPVLINGVTVYVLSNLGLALKCLRHERSERALWIDFLCINQANTPELNDQVQQMGDIYQSAAQVVAFVGDAAQGIEEAMQFLVEICQDKHFPELMGAPAPSEQALKKTGYLLHLLTRDYYKRVWTIQELALARKSVLQCGKYTVPGDTLERAHSVFSKHLSCCELYLQNNDFIGSIYSALDVAASRWNLHLERNNYTLASLITMFPEQDALDPRDQVFSLLGLLDPAQRLIRPDYSLSTEQVYTKTAIEILKHSTDLCYLAHVNYTDRNPNLPSWVPDLSRHPIRGLAFRTYHEFSCGGPAEAAIHIDSETELILKGLFVDTVSEVDLIAYPLSLPNGGLKNQREARGLYEYLLHIEAMASSLLPQSKNRASSASEDLLHAVWRTASKGVIEVAPLELRRLQPEDYPSCAKAKRLLGTFAEYPESSPPSEFFAMIEEENVWRYSLIFTAVAQRSRFFLTSQPGVPPRMGMGPLEILPDDRIVILAGGSMPFVVRRLNRQSADTAGDEAPERDCYALVGIVYVDGIMDGVTGAGEQLEWEDVHLR